MILLAAMTFFEFASGSPYLTFFLFLVVGQTLIYVAQALRGTKDCDCDCHDDEDK
jgi:hypothetical protein